VGAPQPPTFSFFILLTLLVVAGASAATFWVLVRRATSHRQWVALSEWSRETGFRVSRGPSGEPPPPFSQLPNVHPVTRMQLSKGPITLVQLEAQGAAAPVAAAAIASVPHVAAVAAAGTSATVTWNLLIRQLESTWRPTGLRPANAAASVLDLFSLSSFPMMGSTDRFVAYGTDSAAARAVSKSMLRSLLPADVGLLLHGRHMVLDFSARPFDSMELSRIIALADQVAAHLPAAP